MLGLAAANLAGAPLRTSVAVASLMIAIGMMVAVAVLVASFRTTVVAWADETLRADLFVRPLGLGDASTDARFSPHVAQRIAGVPGVAAVETLRAVELPFRGRLMTLGATDLAQLGVRSRLRLLAGPDARALARTLPGTREVLVSEPFATKFGVGPGDPLVLPSPDGPVRFVVAAVYNDYSSDAGVVLVDVRTYRRLFHDDAVNSIVSGHAADDQPPGLDGMNECRVVETSLPGSVGGVGPPVEGRPRQEALRAHRRLAGLEGGDDLLESIIGG